MASLALAVLPVYPLEPLPFGHEPWSSSLKKCRLRLRNALVLLVFGLPLEQFHGTWPLVALFNLGLLAGVVR